MNTVTPMPKFAGASSLSLTHLQRLADAVTHLRDGVHSSPGAQPRGAALPGMAYYLPPGVDFEESGQTYTAAWNEPGLVQGIACVPRQHAPTIVEGVIRLPFAQTMWEEEDSGATPGVVHGVVFGECEAPCLDQGRVMIPYADVQGCGGVVTPGVLRGVRLDPNATQPWIDEGVLVLQSSGAEVPLADSASGVVGRVGSVEYGSATGKPQISQGRIQIPVAHYDGCIGAVGVISGIKMDYGYEPMICDGVISLPFAPLGLADSCGGLVKWLDLYGTSLVRIKDGGADHLGYSAQILPNGALEIYIDRQ